MTGIRPPAVAGMFYPAAPAELIASVDALLASAGPSAHAPPKALIVPHAGYIYSGATAALAYASLAQPAQQIKRVVLLGPTHRLAVNGIAAPESTAFATPLGNIALDLEALAALRDLPQIGFSDPVHAEEHSLEVHLPFLQRVLGDFKLLPLAVGASSPQAVAEVLERLWGGPETLIVVSSDLSHFLNYSSSQQVDRNTCQQILQLEHTIQPQQACGAHPVNGLLLAARHRKLKPELIHLCNSGDTAGDKNRVVGYAAFAFYEPNTTEPGATLLALARNAIALHLGLAETLTVNRPELLKNAATFVTLSQNGQLRGCIGSLQAYRPLLDDIRQNACNAAFRDPRFKPLSAAELPLIRVEVSLLSPAETIQFNSEADALAQLRPHIDGIIFTAGKQRSTFLPQVWEQLPKPADFIAQLKQKAGLPADYWGSDVKLERYTVKKWQEAAR